mmetsp:Transcript_14058/g.31849  ORF Transcript_14058/g.31849 Transcript_14058/m.31849 type:complete len:622 (+) Transcript_14058:70-1935(+)
MAKWDDFKLACAGGCCACTCLSLLIGLIVILCSIVKLDPREQVVVKSPDGWWTKEGPWQGLMDPGKSKEYRKATLLQENDYALVKNFRTGARRIEEGPHLMFIGAYEELVHVEKKIVMQVREYARLRNVLNGSRFVVDGQEQSILVPGPYDEIEILAEKRTLEVTDYVRLKNSLTGVNRIIAGPALIMPGPYEEVMETTRKVELQLDQYVRVINSETGSERIVRGPATFVPDPMDTWQGVQDGVYVAADQALVARDKVTGVQRLVTELGVFVPNDYEEVVELRNLVRVGPQEAVVVRGPDGNFVVHDGRSGGAQGTSFFLLPYYHQISMVWSQYVSPTEISRTSVNVIDLTWRRLAFQYEAHTSDNVKLLLEGVVFWRIANVHALLNATGDPESDVWYHSRSVLIQAVSQSNLDTFMKEFNNITQQAFIAQSKDGFYDTRGVEVQSMEVTRFECVDPETAAVLQEIIQETTNRINRLQTQESENEVRASALTANIQLELQRGQLIRTQAANVRLEASTGGAKDGARLAAEASTFINGLNQTVDNATMRLDLYKMHEEHRTKNNQTQSLSKGDAKLYLVPSDLNLRLDVANGAGDSADSGARRLRGSRPNQEQEDEGAPLEL